MIVVETVEHLVVVWLLWNGPIQSGRVGKFIVALL